MDNKGMWGGMYGLAFLGGLVYYIQHATTFLAGVLGIFKAIFWPAVPDVQSARASENVDK